MKRTIPLILFISATFILPAQTRDSRDDGRGIRIPVVFHILYTNNTENIADDLIANELADLNSDFAATNDMSVIDSEFKSLVGNANIQFYLLDTMFQPTGMQAVRRVQDNNQNWDQYLINPKVCLNVFIADHGNASDVLSDRVNLYFKDVGKHSHVLTHETGHWLGLYHTWGQIGSCNAFTVAFGNHDDKIDDTPLQWKCTDLTYSTTCPPNVKIYYKGHKVMYNNFMDYSGCRCMFTIKQAIKMRNNIIKSKPQLF